MNIKKVKPSAITPSRRGRGESIGPFVVALRDLDVGQCIQVDGLTSNHRQAISVLKFAYGRDWTVRTVGENFQITRLA